MKFISISYYSYTSFRISSMYSFIHKIFVFTEEIIEIYLTVFP